MCPSTPPAQVCGACSFALGSIHRFYLFFFFWILSLRLLSAARSGPNLSQVSQASSTDMLLAHNAHHPSMASMDSHRTHSSVQGQGQGQGNYFSQGSAHPSQAMLHEPHSTNTASSTASAHSSQVSGSYTRSGNLPMPSSSHQGSSSGYLQNHYGYGHEAAASVGLSGVLSAGNSLTVGPSAITREIGLRKSSFGPGTQDRNVAEAVSALQTQTQQGSQGSHPGAQSQQGQSSNFSLRTPRFSGGHINTQTMVATGANAPVQVLPAMTPTSAGSGTGSGSCSGNGASNDGASNASSLTPPPAGGTTSHRPSLHRLTSRSKMTAGQNFLHNNHIHMPHVAGSGANSHTPSVAPVPTRLEVRDILHRLTGKEHMDTVCCRYDLTYHEIVNYPGVQLIYK